MFASTVDVYGIPSCIITEESDASPDTLYGWSKLFCEKIIEQLCIQRGLSCAILSLGHIDGEGEEIYRKVMPAMIESAIAGRSLTIIGDADAKRSFIHVGDVARAIGNAVRGESDYLVNIVGEEPVTVGELASMVNKNAGNEAGVSHTESVAPRRDFVFD